MRAVAFFAVCQDPLSIAKAAGESGQMPGKAAAGVARLATLVPAT
jgi:hypothetical protein